MTAPKPPLDLEAAESLRLFDLIVREARKPVEAERDALRAAIQAAHPVIQYVSRGRGYVGVEPYPDATARRANALIGECLAAAVEGTPE